jgi:hypothetical protein
MLEASPADRTAGRPAAGAASTLVDLNEIDHIVGGIVLLFGVVLVPEDHQLYHQNHSQDESNDIIDGFALKHMGVSPSRV